MQFIFPLILIGALGLGVIILTWLGLSQRRRGRNLARLAYQIDMRFSASDPFNLVKRYSAFVLFQAGHSLRTRNVIYGRFKGWHLKVFDYQFEVGHGTHRSTRRYSVLSADTDFQMPNVLLWNVEDNEYVPAVLRKPDGQIDGWYILGEVDLAESLAATLGTLAKDGINAETAGGTVMIYSREPGKPSQLADRIIRFTDALANLKERVN